MILTDASGTVRAANPAYCARHQLQPEYLIGESFAITFPEAERTSAMVHYAEVFATRGDPDAYPAVSRWRDDPVQITESRIVFATQRDGQSFMLSSIRLIPHPPRDASALPSLVHGPTSIPADEIIIDAVRDWSVEVVFGHPGDPRGFMELAPPPG